jgi:hypothetical protein
MWCAKRQNASSRRESKRITLANFHDRNVKSYVRVFERNRMSGEQDFQLSGLTFRYVFAEHTLVALEPPFAVRTILKPFGDANLGMNLAIHHRNAGLVAVGNDLFQADLAVA